MENNDIPDSLTDDQKVGNKPPHKKSRKSAKLYFDKHETWYYPIRKLCERINREKGLLRYSYICEYTCQNCFISTRTHINLFLRIAMYLLYGINAQVHKRGDCINFPKYDQEEIKIDQDILSRMMRKIGRLANLGRFETDGTMIVNRCVNCIMYRSQKFLGAEILQGFLECQCAWCYPILFSTCREELIRTYIETHPKLVWLLSQMEKRPLKDYSTEKLDVVQNLSPLFKEVEEGIYQPPTAKRRFSVDSLKSNDSVETVDSYVTATSTVNDIVTIDMVDRAIPLRPEELFPPSFDIMIQDMEIDMTQQIQQMAETPVSPQTENAVGFDICGIHQDIINPWGLVNTKGKIKYYLSREDLMQGRNQLPIKPLYDPVKKVFYQRPELHPGIEGVMKPIKELKDCPHTKDQIVYTKTLTKNAKVENDRLLNELAEHVEKNKV